MRRLAVILGAPVDDVTMNEAIDRIFAFVESGRASGRTHQIATVNVDFIVQAEGNPRLRRILQRTDLSIPDGMPLIWASRLFGTPLRERVTGADLVPALAERAAERGTRMFFFGSAPGVAARAATLLADTYPGIDVIGSEGAAVSADGEMAAEALAPIVDARPDILCVALGNPKQEFWIERYGAATGAPVCIGIGGTLDLLVGEKRRAPQWMQRGGLEWVFRAAQEPRRLIGRYAHDIVVFAPRLARQAWIGGVRRTRRGTASLLTSGDTDVVTLSGSPCFEDLAHIDGAGMPGRGLAVDIGQLNGPDNRGAAVLASIVLEWRGVGGDVRLSGVNERQRRQLDALGISEMFAAPTTSIE